MLTLAEVWEAITGKRPPYEQAEAIRFTEVVVDSRLARPGSLFVALKGEQTDGHDYVRDALQRGALGAIVERQVSGCASSWSATTRRAPSKAPLTPICLRAKHSLEALQRLAAYWRGRHAVRVIGITGSTGKTTTKETIASVLGMAYRTLKSEGNYNNEIGLPLTLLQLEPEHQRVVLEMGMYQMGEIAQLAHIARPQVGVVTNVGPSHLERLGSLARIAQAKAELVEALPGDGYCILNADDPRVLAMAERAPSRVMTYGLDPASQVRASNIESRGLEGVRFQLHYEGETLHVKIPLLGRHSVHTALAAAAVGLVEGESWEQIIAGLRDISAQLRLIARPGVNGSTLIDDSYNASPDSSLAALNLLAELPGRKIAVLGDMLELGQYEEKGHALVGRRAAAVADALITVGPRARISAEEAGLSGLPSSRITSVKDNAAAIQVLRKMIQPGDVVLIKGSRALRMEEIVAQLERR